MKTEFEPSGAIRSPALTCPYCKKAFTNDLRTLKFKPNHNFQQGKIFHLDCYNQELERLRHLHD